ncbi:hypothetical protein GEMRC1_007026 [Eukaryota sp. GEM-RC1]
MSALILFNFDAESPREVSVRTGDTVTIVSGLDNYKMSGWTKVLKSPDVSGWVPSTFISPEVAIYNSSQPVGISKDLIKHDYITTPSTFSLCASFSSLPPCDRYSFQKSFPVTFVPFSVPGIGSFSEDVDSVVDRYPASYDLSIPILPARLIGFIYKNALHVPTLFRSSPSIDDLTAFIAKLDNSEFAEIPPSTCPLLVGAALKRYLRSLPTPLISSRMFLSLNPLLQWNNVGDIVRSLRVVLVRLSSTKGSLLATLMWLLSEVSRSNSSLTAQSLSVLFGPCVFSCESSSSLDSSTDFFSQVPQFAFFC